MKAEQVRQSSLICPHGVFQTEIKALPIGKIAKINPAHYPVLVRLRSVD
ncbi:hypothetical protein WAE56_05395 [Iodobacter sp. LRB]|nr:hypothetical protein [Iodobacter sp. BJB302]